MLLGRKHRGMFRIEHASPQSSGAPEDRPNATGTGASSGGARRRREVMVWPTPQWRWRERISCRFASRPLRQPFDSTLTVAAFTPTRRTV
jgi:hypothetical protein